MARIGEYHHGGKIHHHLLCANKIVYSTCIFVMLGTCYKSFWMMAGSYLCCCVYVCVIFCHAKLTMTEKIYTLNLVTIFFHYVFIICHWIYAFSWFLAVILVSNYLYSLCRSFWSSDGTKIKRSSQFKHQNGWAICHRETHYHIRIVYITKMVMLIYVVGSHTTPSRTMILRLWIKRPSFISFFCFAMFHLMDPFQCISF